ncbi:type II toxin-antitoxin system VapC family toxin [Candidatus Bathyarchaeota archaeon]|nr:MAG: type II toxin-antitoxin system VapC family toxin [Candidatus Bathyarchaeota archaeon]
MKKICLDTDFIVALLRNHPEAVKKAEEYDSVKAEISTTSMNAFEIYLGAFRSRMAEKNVKQADDLLNAIKVLELDLESSRKASEILSRLIHEGEPIDLRDAIIAGIALTNGCTLITRNTERFKRITGLSIETW